LLFKSHSSQYLKQIVQQDHFHEKKKVAHLQMAVSSIGCYRAKIDKSLKMQPTTAHLSLSSKFRRKPYFFFPPIFKKVTKEWKWIGFGELFHFSSTHAIQVNGISLFVSFHSFWWIRGDIFPKGDTKQYKIFFRNDEKKWLASATWQHRNDLNELFPNIFLPCFLKKKKELSWNGRGTQIG